MEQNQPSTLQTLVVHTDQLTPENLKQLGEAGYRAIRDPQLIIFARPVPANPTGNPQLQALAPSEDDDENSYHRQDDISDVTPISPNSGGGRKHRR